MPFLQQLSDALIWKRDAIAQGQLWRLATGNFVHLSWGHALANVIGLAIWWRMESLSDRPLSARTRIAVLATGSIGVGVLLFFFSSYQWYAGASGVVYGLFALTALRSGARGLVMLGLLLTWLLMGPRYVSYSFPVAVDAHWSGLALGMALALTLRACQWLRRGGPVNTPA